MGLVLWLILAAILVVAEMVSLGLTTIWFAGGALVAAVACYFGANWLVQFVVFAVVSLLLLIFTRPVAQKHLMKDPEKTNIDSLIGQSGIVTVAIDNLTAAGTVKLNGLEWSARTVDDTKIDEGATVRVVKISGVKLIVEAV